MNLIPTTVFGCQECKVNTKEAFCNKCGNKNASYSINRPVDISNTIKSDIGERLVFVDLTDFKSKIYGFWIPNVSFLDRNPHIPGYEGSEVQVTENLIWEETRQFKEAFAKEIHTLQTVYEDHEVVWGSLFWSN